MRYTGMTCEACKRVFEETDDVVCCPVCGAPEHRSCWQESGRCANEAKHAEGYQWQMPEKLKPADNKEEKIEMTSSNVKFPDGTHSITCPHCGAENFPDDIYCRACHEPIKKDSLFDFSQERQQENSCEDSPYGQNPAKHRQNMYNAYSLYGGLNPDSEIDGIPVHEYADYIGGNSGAYIRKFSIAEHFRKNTIWNWAAAVFGPIWFLGRKQTKIGAIMFAVIIALSAVAGILSLTDANLKYVGDIVEASQTYSAEYASGTISYEEMLEKVNSVAANAQAEFNASKSTPRDIAAAVIEYVIITISVVFSGLYGNRFYKEKVKRDILASREKCTSADSYRAMLMSRGGFSVGLALVGVVLQLISWGLLTFLPLLYVLLNGYE